MNAKRVLDLARAAGTMIATAESCTGGLLAGALTEIPGASDVFDRGFVTYSNAAKHDLLGVDPNEIHRHGAVSEPVARSMAEGALARSGAQVAISITGVAGPGGTAEKPEGMVCFGLARAGVATLSETQLFGAVGRSSVRQLSVAHALTLLAKSLS